VVTVSIARDDVSPSLGRTRAGAASGGALLRVLGRAGANSLIRHFRDRNRTPNRLGGERTNFWSRVAESVNAPVISGSRIEIRVSHPAIAQKVYGGTIVPRKAKALAIPVDRLAYGKSPRVMDGLFFVPSTSSGAVGILARRESGGGIRPMYVLKRSVTQQPDPKALPADAEVTTAMREASADFIA